MRIISASPSDRFMTEALKNRAMISAASPAAVASQNRDGISDSVARGHIGRVFISGELEWVS
jgi:hypothetical protein